MCATKPRASEIGVMRKKLDTRFPKSSDIGVEKENEDSKGQAQRAKASICISRSVQRLGVDGIKTFGMEKQIEIGASQLSDRLPESRDAVRALLLELQSAYQKSHVQDSTIVSDEPTLSWEDFCQSKFSTLSAQAVIRVTNTARGGLVMGSYS